jgi:hypothetical protein
MLHTVSKHFTSALVHSFNCCLFSCWMVRFFIPKIYLYLCPIPIPIPICSNQLHPITFYVLLQLLCPFSCSCRMVRFFVPWIYFYFHPFYSITFPSHPSPISILPHSLLCTPSIVAPTSCQMVRFFVPKVYLYPIPIPSPSHHLLFTTSIVAPFSCWTVHSFCLQDIFKSYS